MTTNDKHQEHIDRIVDKCVEAASNQVKSELERRLREAIKAIDPNCTNATLRTRLLCYELSDGSKEYYFDNKPLFGASPPKFWVEGSQFHAAQDFYPIAEPLPNPL